AVGLAAVQLAGWVHGAAFREAYRHPAELARKAFVLPTSRPASARRPLGWPPVMSNRATQRPWRRVAGRVLGVVAAAKGVLEPFASGAVLVSLTREHGVDVGDLPAVALYLAAAFLALWPP